MMTVSSEVVDREVSRVAHDGPDRPHVQCVFAVCLPCHVGPDAIL